MFMHGNTRQAWPQNRFFSLIQLEAQAAILPSAVTAPEKRKSDDKKKRRNISVILPGHSCNWRSVYVAMFITWLGYCINPFQWYFPIGSCVRWHGTQFIVRILLLMLSSFEKSICVFYLTCSTLCLSVGREGRSCCIHLASAYTPNSRSNHSAMTFSLSAQKHYLSLFPFIRPFEFVCVEYSQFFSVYSNTCNGGPDSKWFAVASFQIMYICIYIVVFARYPVFFSLSVLFCFSFAICYSFWIERDFETVTCTASFSSPNTPTRRISHSPRYLCAIPSTLLCNAISSFYGGDVWWFNEMKWDPRALRQCVQSRQRTFGRLSKTQRRRRRRRNDYY